MLRMTVRLRTLAWPASVLLLASLMVVAVPPSVCAQSELAWMSGRITDSHNRALVDAAVEIVNVATNASVTATTDRDGFYVFPSLRPGRYLMHVRARLFKSVSVTGVVLYV